VPFFLAQFFHGGIVGAAAPGSQKQGYQASNPKGNNVSAFFHAFSLSFFHPIPSA
jgi:hypothetical protein